MICIWLARGRDNYYIVGESFIADPGADPMRLSINVPFLATLLPRLDRQTNQSIEGVIYYCGTYPL